VPPGRIYHMYKNTLDKKLSIEESKHDIFTEIVVSPHMYTDHMPNTYEQAFRDLVSNDDSSLL
jgi:hypothetical protein